MARCSAHPVLLAGSQETPGLGGRLPLGAKPHGHRAIYLEVSPPRPLPPLQEKRTLRTPASSLPPTRFAEEGDPHPPWYQGTAACCPFPQPPQVIFLLKLPSRVAWGPGPFLPPLPVLFMFFSHMEVGFPRGAGQCSPAQSVTQRGFRLEPVCSVGSASLVPRPHCEVTAALIPLLFYLLNLIWSPVGARAGGNCSSSCHRGTGNARGSGRSHNQDGSGSQTRAGLGVQFTGAHLG